MGKSTINIYKWQCSIAMFVYLTVTSLTFLDPLGMSQVMSRLQYSMRFRQGAKENLEVRGFKMLIDTPSQDQQVVLFAQTYKRDQTGERPLKTTMLLFS